MSDLPKIVRDLCQKYGHGEITRHEYNVSPDEFREDEKTSYGSCMIAKTREGEFVLIRMSYVLPHGAAGPDTWSLICGKSEDGESFEETAIRETFEETGRSHTRRSSLERLSQSPTIMSHQRSLR